MKKETTEKDVALKNFKKAHSHLSSVIEMVENGHYCIDIMQQNLAVIGLLRSAHRMLMENHLHSCFNEALASKNQDVKQKMVEEVLKVTSLANK